jgi:uncharacterized repeat protein (TIGR04052 family)
LAFTPLNIVEGRRLVKRTAILFFVLFPLVSGAECLNLGPAVDRVSLKFAAQFGDAEARCGEVFGGLGMTGENCEVLDLRFFVSNIRLINHDGEEVPLVLDQDDRWQVENVALLDFEDATGGCGDSGTASRNSVVLGSVPEGHYHGVVFDIGVPFELNHSDMAAAPAPLNVSAMFWTWAAGRKFLRVDVKTESGTQWNVHVGSTMCESDGATDPPVSACGRPNRAAIGFSEFDHEHDVIVLDVQELLAAVDVTQDTPGSSAGCQSFPGDEAECTNVFPKLGLDFATGACSGDCANQTVFRLESGVDRGLDAFSRVRETTEGEMFSCLNCHGDDGSGDVGPDIRSSNADHIMEHPAGDAPHPVKFADLSPVQANDIAVWLAVQCAADVNCVPGSVGGGHHDDAPDDTNGGNDNHDHEP